MYFPYVSPSTVLVTHQKLAEIHWFFCRTLKNTVVKLLSQQYTKDTLILSFKYCKDFSKNTSQFTLRFRLSSGAESPETAYVVLDSALEAEAQELNPT